MNKATIETNSELRMLRLPEVKQRVGLGRSTIYEKIKHHQFPSPIKVGPRAVAWVSVEIVNWIQAQIAASRDANYAFQGS